jgi:hypothetical protein
VQLDDLPLSAPHLRYRMGKLAVGGIVFQQPEQVPARRSKIVSPEQADARLGEMGLSVKIVHESITAGDDARRRVTNKYYPRNFPGMTMWAETIAMLRRQLLKLRQGWRIGKTGNYETVYSTGQRIAFAVVAGNGYTGIDGKRDPKLTRKRGPKTQERVQRNAEFVQLELAIPGLPEPKKELPADEDCSTWFLLVYADDDEVRMEVSLPLDLGADGLGGDWVERILLPPLPISGAVAPIEPDEDDDDEGPMVTRPA